MSTQHQTIYEARENARELILELSRWDLVTGVKGEKHSHVLVNLNAVLLRARDIADLYEEGEKE